MARSISQWYDIIIAQKATMSELSNLAPSIDSTQTLLNDVQSTSKVADWRLWIFIAAFIAWARDVVNDQFEASIEEKINRPYGTLPWYKKVALEFQFGHPLVWLGDRYGYATVDTGSRIVKRAAVLEIGRLVRIKCANFVSGAIIPLPAAAVSAFDTYIKALRPAGISVVVSSGPPDLLKLSVKVYYSPLVLQSNGESLITSGSFPVRDAINTYLSELDFGGQFDINSLEDAIQSTEGVIQGYIQSAEAKFGALPYVAVTETYIADAGYMVIDPAFPLSTQITYLPGV